MKILFLLSWLFPLFPLEQTKIRMQEQILCVEIANTAASRREGLMGRKFLDPHAGMLFVYETPQELSFWMKNTHIPLSIGFFDQEQTLLHWLDMLPNPTPPYPLYKSSQKALYALEVPLGWFEKHKICPGMKFSFFNQEDSIE